MKLRILVLSSQAALALAAPAQAADHQMRVTEVHTSPSNPALGFVELQDKAAETFPATSYTLASHDGSGAVIGQQTFTPPYGFSGSSQPFLVGAAEVQPRDATLTISLAGARKVCFYRGTGTADPINCLTFGEVPDGQSAQLTSSGGVVLACPTPDAPNRDSAGTCSAPAPTQPPPPSGQPAPDLVAPRQFLVAKRTQRLGRLAVRVRVNEPSTLIAVGSMKVGKKRLVFRKVKRFARAGVRVTIRFKLTKKNARIARRALRRGRKLTATIKVAARDRAGNTSRRKRAVRVKL